MRKTVLNAFDVNLNKRLLNDIFKQFPINPNFHWSVIFFEGVADFPNNLTHDDFITEIAHSPYGFLMNSTELLEFSEKIMDITDILLVGYTPPPNFDKRLLLGGFYENCETVIELFDSTEWTILN